MECGEKREKRDERGGLDQSCDYLMVGGLRVVDCISRLKQETLSLVLLKGWAGV